MTSYYQPYPAEQLPLPSADYSGKVRTNTATTTFASGRVRRRRLGYGKYYTVKLTWQLSPEEYDFFIGWWEYTLSLGVMPFSVYMATGAAYGEHLCQLVDDPDFTHQDYFWKVSCDAVVFEKPEMGEIDVITATDPTAAGAIRTLPDVMGTYFTESWI